MLDGVFVPESAVGLRRPKGTWHPFFNVINNHVRWHVCPQRCLTNCFGAGSLVQTIRLLAVGAEEREQPLHADIGVDEFDL